ncbi:MAG: NAD(P)-binding protein, partial [Pseudomonadota bacterium]
MRVAIIGAGLTGLTAGRALHTAGLAPVIYDKGRGVGGRLSTRRAEGGLQFDHGAQYLPAKSDAFRTFLSEIEVAGAVGRWTLDDGSEKAVGAPGMTAIGKHLATGLDVRLGVEVPSIRRTNGGWAVAGGTFDRVICTAPAP